MRILGIDGVDFPDYAAQNRREHAITAAREAVIAAAKAWKANGTYWTDTQQALLSAVETLNALEATDV